MVTIRGFHLLPTIVGVVFLLTPASVPAEQGVRPNIVFLLVDDLGIKDLSCYGSDFHESPNIDELASQGIRYTNAYASHPVCGPSRSAIMTGKFPARMDLTYIPGAIREGETTWPKVLQANEYSTCFVGKWHMGSAASVLAHGFDVNIAGNNNGQPSDYYFPYKSRLTRQNVPDMEDGKPGDYLTDALTDKALKFLDDNGDKPFLLYFSYYNVHKPFKTNAQGKREHVDYFRNKLETMPGGDPVLHDEVYGGCTIKALHLQRNPEFAGQIKALDDSVGRIMRKLKDIGVADNTIIFFTSDQGSVCTSSKYAVSSARPYRGGKSFMAEGGIRVPFIVKWPKHMTAGTINDTVTINTDIYPTVMDMVGLPQDKAQHPDGISIVDTFKGKTIPFDRTFYWAYPFDQAAYGHKSSLAVRKGPHKLIFWPQRGVTELYNVETDISELNDLSKEQPELTSGLLNHLKEWGPANGILAQFKQSQPTKGTRN